MKNFVLIFVAIVFLFGWNATNAQTTVQLSIVNQTVVGTDFFFDIKMQATSGTLYLASADLVLTFNSGNFTGPVVTKGLAGTFVLNNTNGDNTTDLGVTVGALYRQNVTPAAITSNEIIINLGLVPFSSDQAVFNSDIAKIDNALYSFGTYKVSGITTPAGTMGLAWKTGGGGVITQILTYANTTPWNTSPVTIDASPAITDAPLPVELTSFTATLNNGVELKWETATEVNNYGFEIERKYQESSIEYQDSSNWEKIGFVEGNGTTNSPKFYSYIDENLPDASEVSYRLKQIDLDGIFAYSKVIVVDISTITGVTGEDLIYEFSLDQNYPNPFNPSTTIQFTIPSVETGYIQSQPVKLNVFNSIGQHVITLVDEIKSPGIYKVNFDASRFSSGVYFYTLDFGKLRQTKKLILMK